ncbi:MAG TPA: hypothetical protein VGC42_10110 [Kofleriaceae bacterium]
MWLVAALAFAAGCEKPDHDNIEKWQHTQKGPEKLRKALASETIDADLSAHAAANLIRQGDDRDARAAFEAMAPARRSQVVAKLAPRLWQIARVENEKELPGPPQVAAKDALVMIRPWADPATRATIDSYLIDWYCVASFEDRSKNGAILGPAVMRQVGPPAAKKLISVLDGVIAAPGQGEHKNRIGDNLLHGLAATGSPDAVKYLLDLTRLDRGDKTLTARSLAALYEAYVDPAGAFAPADPQGLVPSAQAIVDIAKDDTQSSRVANDAVGLIRALPPPACLDPLIQMVSAPHRNPDFKFVVANNALKCGGAKAIPDVVRALPDAGTYQETQLTREISGEIAKLTPRDQAVAATRPLLGEKSTVVKWVAIEALAAMKSTEDAAAIAGLAGNRERLAGYWGDQAGKPDPTLGERAKQLAAELGGK